MTDVARFPRLGDDNPNHRLVVLSTVSGAKLASQLDALTSAGDIGKAISACSSN